MLEPYPGEFCYSKRKSNDQKNVWRKRWRSWPVISQRADSAIKKRQQLENHNSANEEQCDKLEGQLKEDKFTMAESERKYEDIARKLATMEGELERSNDRCTTGEKKILDLEEELRVVGQNLQQLEVSEEKALQREENYQNQIKNLTDSLKTAENREENATMNIQRLNIRIDQIEEDLLNEKLKIKAISDDLDSTIYWHAKNWLLKNVSLGGTLLLSTIYLLPNHFWRIKMFQPPAPV